MEYWNCASCRMTFLLFPAIFVGVETKRRSTETVFDAYGALELSESSKSNVSNEATVPPAGKIGRRGCSNLASAGGIFSNKSVSLWLKTVLEAAITGTSELMLGEEQETKKKKKKVRSTDSGHLLADSNLSNLSDSQSIKITRMSMPCGQSLLDKFKDRILAEDGFGLTLSNTSRSGAAFFWSSNRKFILKTMPSKEEFDFLSKKPSLFDAYFESVGYNELQTSINPVLLSFQTEARTVCLGMRKKTDTQYWVLMPAESVSTMLVSASEKNIYDLTTDGNKMMDFDVKPEPIYSLQRSKFFEEVGKRTRGFGFGESWDNHDMQMATIIQDVEFLNCPTCFVGEGKAARLIDYSIFPMFQKVTIQRLDEGKKWPDIFQELKGKLPRCLWKTVNNISVSGIPENETQVQVDFMCVAVIDYLMNWEDLGVMKKKGENNLPWIYKKWDNWGAKIKELFVCMSYPCAKAKKGAKKARVYKLDEVEVLDGGRTVTREILTPHVKGCGVYRKHFSSPRVSRNECNQRQRCSSKWKSKVCKNLAKRRKDPALSAEILQVA